MFWKRAPMLSQRRFLAMGTEVSLKVFPNRGIRQHQIESGLAEVQELLVDFGREGWAWGPGALGDFNRTLAKGFEAAIPENLKPLFQRAWNFRETTQGLFEPRIGSLVRLWGFDDVGRIRASPPTATKIDRLAAAVREAPPFTDNSHYGPATGVTWDFGAVGKGYIVDRAMALLASHGIENATIDAGGNVSVLGAHGDRSWRIGIRDPRPTTPTGLIAALDVRNESVVTHGDDQRYFEFEGQRYSHVLDPRSGWPARGLRSLTVVHESSTLADGLGAALFVSGPDHWPSLAKDWGLDQVLAVEETGQVIATPRLASRLDVRSDIRVCGPKGH